VVHRISKACPKGCECVEEYLFHNLRILARV
jgi:hypothetical protein